MCVYISVYIYICCLPPYILYFIYIYTHTRTICIYCLPLYILFQLCTFYILPAFQSPAKKLPFRSQISAYISCSL